MSLPRIPGHLGSGYDPETERQSWLLSAHSETHVGMPHRGQPGSSQETRYRVDSLARRYLRYVHAIGAPMASGEEGWARAQRAELMRRVDRVKVYQHDHAPTYLGAVLQRVDQILNPNDYLSR